MLQEIEENLGKPIARLEITKADYQYTKLDTEEKVNDWQSIVNDIQQDELIYKKGKKKKKKKNI